jgi:hypothetical protein
MGDLEGHLKQLLSLLRTLRYQPERATDVDGLRSGAPAACLPLLRFAFLSFSRHVTRWLLSAGHEARARRSGHAARFVCC